ncbi:hypothetical protein RND71_012578 [Anisodus tanguticus]|uniref:Uncharacterized protein n=1 Tax=Anisodus tanguticus TaxID=243964 RepID=A0AAE1VLW2_9SOLA|nr:hypothetical protein RND71_012578 [Anisodus tanguticus]
MALCFQSPLYRIYGQSLGSPGSKLHLAQGVVIVGDRDNSAAAVTAADQASPSLSNNYDEEDEQVRKSIKTLNKSLSRAKKYIHLIPVLTFFYSANIDELQRVLEIGKADVLAIRNVRNLQEIDRQDPKHRLHRKLADF